MRILKLTAIIFAAVSVIAMTSTWGTPKPAAPLTPKQQHNLAVNAAIEGCKIVTTRTSKLAVAEFVEEYELTGHAKPGHYLVGVDYRAKGAGVLMWANCEYQDAGDGKVALVRASSGIKRAF